MAKLLIVESPAKAKTISKYVGDGYIVRASVGHVRDLPKSNKAAIDIEGGFVPHYEILKGKEKIVAELEKLAHTSDGVILATDPDREGEAIAWHIAELIGKKAKGAKRITYHEITKEAIEEALKHPRDIDENLRRAQEARRVLDRLVGYDLSGLIWKKVRYGLSAGRVQSPALRILMEREREIRAFIPVTFWTIVADVATKLGDALEMKCAVEPTEQKEMERIVERAKAGVWNVKDVTETVVNRSPRAPFTTSTLQQAANSRLGLTPSRTMGIAQRLYEAGLITYMRTDSVTLSPGAQGEIVSLVQKEYGNQYSHPQSYKTKSKNAQEAHEAIRPTKVTVKSAGGTPEQKKLYRLIWQRAVASQMMDAITLRTKISTVPDPDIPEFAAHGSRITFDGWLRADPEARSDEVELPKVASGEPLTLKEVRSNERQTEPPSRYSEAGLVKELEKRGIGRPSTYASTIKTLGDRGYTEKIGRTLKPTDTGDVVSTFLEAHFPTYVSDTFTATMEDELDEIADGKRDYAKTLKEFYGPFHKEVKAREKDTEKATTFGKADPAIVCPVCGSGMVIKLGRGGKFLSCERFPDCKGGRTMDGKEIAPPKETGEDCPECKKGKLVEREGKFGMFIACSRYPRCRFIKNSENNIIKPTTDVHCPVCKEGFMTERHGRFGPFWSCSNYPTCKNAIKAKPTGNICPMCQSLMMEGTKTIPERCSNKVCANHNPHKLDVVK